MTTPPDFERIQHPRLRIIALAYIINYDNTDNDSDNYFIESPPINPSKSIVRQIKRSHPVLFDIDKLV